MPEIRNPACLIPSLLLFLIPVNIVLLGEAGTGLQWVLFRCQCAAGDGSLFSSSQDLYAALTGLITGQVGTAIIIWALAALLLIVYFAVTVWAMYREDALLLKRGALLLLACGALFLVADLVQYGVLLSGPEGSCIPAGILLCFLFGTWGYRGYSAGLGAGEQAEKRPAKKRRIAGSGPAGTSAGIVSRLVAWAGAHKYHEIATLVVISLVVKVCAFFIGVLPNLSLYVILGDTRLYYWYASSVTWGQIPYASYNVPYPQFFFIPVLVALVPALIVQGYTIYLWAFSALMVVLDTATLVLVWSIARRLWGRERAFLCGLLSATAISAAFFVPIYYDAVPAFLLVLSLWVYLYRDQAGGFLVATAGALTKWYPAFALPCYLIHQKKTGTATGTIARECLLAGGLVLAATVPFILLNATGFFNTYTTHIGRTAEVNSLMYYLDAIGASVGFGTVSAVSLLLVLAAELALLYWYYRSPDTRPETLISCIFIAIFVFVLCNKVFSTNYIIWLTPFLALLLCRTPRHILLFYLVQVVMYLETPALFGIIYTPFNSWAGAAISYSVMAQSLPSLPFLFYTLKFAILFLVLFVVVRDLGRDHVSPGDGLDHTPSGKP
jgi:hypothetical protein